MSRGALSLTTRERLIFALDVPGRAEAIAWIDRLGDSVAFYKIGMELLASGEYFDVLGLLADRGKRVFVDLKFFDIPATAAAVIKRLSQWPVSYATIHGWHPAMMQAAAEANAGDMRLLEQIDQADWVAQRLPEHCYFNLRVIDDGGQELSGGRDLAQLQHSLGQAAAVTFRDNTQEFERDHVTNWDIGTLPESIKFARGKQQLTGYLGLQQEKNGHIALRLFDTPEAAEQAHRQGVIALMQLQLKEHMKDLSKGIQGFTQAAMLLKHIPADTLRDDLTAVIILQVVAAK